MSKIDKGLKAAKELAAKFKIVNNLDDAGEISVKSAKSYADLSHHTPEMVAELSEEAEALIGNNPFYLSSIESAGPKGLGTETLKKAEKTALENGADSIYLQADANTNTSLGQKRISQKGLENFYLKNGYTKVTNSANPTAPLFVKTLAGSAAIPTTSMNPMQYLQPAVEKYQGVKDKIYGALANQLDLTKDKSTAGNIKEVLNVVADPLNAIPGAGGVGAAAIEGMASAKPSYADGGEVESQGMQVFDLSTPEPTLGQLPHEQLQEAVTSGQFALPKGQTIHVYDPDGQLGELPTEEAAEAFKSGFKYALPNEVREAKYGSAGQQAITALEGAAEGVAGPLAPLIERTILRVPKEDILARREENPIVFGTGQAAGLAGSLLTGTGAGALMGKAGQGAAKLAGLGSEAVRSAPLIHKVGSAAVTQAAEMAVLQGSDEVAKMILQDPKSSAESAIANVGLAAALGAGGGAILAGAVSPLWEVTGGPIVEKTLKGLRSHLDGGTALMPDDLKASKELLGVNVSPELEAVMSGNPVAAKHYSILKETSNPGLEKSLGQLNYEVSESVGKSLGISPDDVAVYSENQAGHDLLDAFKKEYKTRYQPIAEAMEKRNAQAAGIIIPDEMRLDQYGKILEKGMNTVGTDAPAYKLYNDYGNRLLAKETIGGMDMLKTEIGGEIEKAMRAGDVNSLQALKDIRSTIAEFQESMIEKQAYQIGKEGLQTAEEIIAQRALANQQYRDFAKLSGELTDHIGVGSFRGAGALTNKLTEKISAEQMLNKFSFKNNADFIPFLQQNFPETFGKVKENELKRFLKSSVLSAKEGQVLNLNKLNSTLEKAMAGQKEYVEALLSPDALNKIQAANKLLSSLPEHKTSGTAGHLSRLMSDIPRSAMAAIAMLTGHNPFVGAILGEVSQKLGRDAPDAVRLAHLKYLGSDQPVKANGFKAMVDFFDSTYKGENLLAKSTKNLFKSGAQVLTSAQMPAEADRKKLDKLVTKVQDAPDSLFEMQKGEVGYYLPNHQEAISQTSTTAIQYLQSIKPKPHILGPLDKPVPPQPAEIARYNRALDIAQKPTVVLQHIKDGNLQLSDIQDINAMYPGLCRQMQQKITNAMIESKASEEMIPYKSRLSMALFLGVPVDGTMTPEAIVAAQLAVAQKQPQAPGQQPKGRSMKAIGKTNESYMTPLQASEAHKAKK